MKFWILLDFQNVHEVYNSTFKVAVSTGLLDFLVALSYFTSDFDQIVPKCTL